MTTAQRLADWHKAMADEPKRNESKRQKHRETEAELRRLESEMQEQCRIIGISGSREARLTAENAQLLEALHHISLCSQNSMSSQRQCGDIARAAIKAATGGKP